MVSITTQDSPKLEWVWDNKALYEQYKNEPATPLNNAYFGERVFRDV
jgi:hypothetical protein